MGAARQNHTILTPQEPVPPTPCISHRQISIGRGLRDFEFAIRVNDFTVLGILVLETGLKLRWHGIHELDTDKVHLRFEISTAGFSAQT